MSSLLPGRKGISEVLQHQPQNLSKIWIREGVKLDSEFRTLIDQQVEAFNISLNVLSRLEFDELAGDNHSQGVLAEVRTELHDEDNLIDLLIKQQGVLLICEQICDPQNLGALFRVAESAGVCGVLLTKDRSVGVTPAVRKTAAGATELIPTAVTKNLQRFLKKLKKRDAWIIGCALDSKSVSIYDAPRLRPCALVVGAEGEGLRRLTQELCDVLVEIPMRGRIQSLNVNQAASIALYELTSPERTQGKLT